MAYETTAPPDFFIQGRRVIHRHAKLLVTDNRIIWEQVGPSEAVCAAIPSGCVDLADFGVVLAEAEAFRERRVEKTVEIVAGVQTAEALKPVNGARRRLLIRKAEELKSVGNHQIAAAHYVVAGLGLLARKELEAAAAILASRGEADRAKRCMDSANEIDPIWDEVGIRIGPERPNSPSGDQFTRNGGGNR
jgi:ABC-type taurine transport system substrate-binding protein